MDSKVKYGVAGALALSAMVGCSRGTDDEPDNGNGVSPPQSRAAFHQPFDGALFTTDVDGSPSNSNIHAAKQDVHLAGGLGPHAPSSAPRLPAGDYFFQVTDPTGKQLLSDDHVSCRRVSVNDAGVIARSLGGTSYEWRAGGWVAVPCKHETGVDEHHAEYGAITVQLMPFDDTPNPGGLYKVWLTPVDEYAGDPNLVPQADDDDVNGEMWAPDNFHGFIPAYSKIDNFMVSEGMSGSQPILRVRKFHDADANAMLDAGEEEITGWRVSINDPLGGANDVYTPATVLADSGAWMLLEDTPCAAESTAARLDDRLLSSYPATHGLVAVNVTGDSHEIMFGNVCRGEARACQRYDADADGIVEPGEPGMAGWHLRLTGTDERGTPVGPIELITGADGCVSFGDLLPGSYQITELGCGGEWMSSGPTSATVQITSSLDGAMLSCTAVETEFTNYCRVTVDFDTREDWQDAQHLAEIDDEDLAYINGLRPFASPSDYFRGGDEPFDDRAELARFLADECASTEPREELAQQLVAFILDTRHRLDGPDAHMQQADGSWISAGQLIDQAIEAWIDGSSAQRRGLAGTLSAITEADTLAVIPALPCALP